MLSGLRKHDKLPMFNMPISINYNQKISIYYYYQLIDIFTSLGGIGEASKIILYIMTPLFMLYFLYGIVGIIQESYTEEYKNQLLISFKMFYKMLPLYSKQRLLSIKMNLKDMTNVQSIQFLNTNLYKILDMLMNSDL